MSESGLPQEEVQEEHDYVQARYTVLADLERGDTPEVVVGYLVREGWNEELARAFVLRVQRGEEKAQQALKVERVLDSTVRAVHSMKVGAAWFVGGALVTVVTYMAASEQGGAYLITWGPMLYGVMRFGSGALAYRRKAGTEAKK